MCYTLKSILQYKAANWVSVFTATQSCWFRGIAVNVTQLIVHFILTYTSNECWIPGPLLGG